MDIAEQFQGLINKNVPMSFLSTSEEMYKVPFSNQDKSLPEDGFVAKYCTMKGE